MAGRVPRGRHQPQGQAGVRREGESQAGAQAGSEGITAEGQKSGLKAGINLGVCLADLHFLRARLPTLKVAPVGRSAIIAHPTGLNPKEALTVNWHEENQRSMIST